MWLSSEDLDEVPVSGVSHQPRQGLRTELVLLEFPHGQHASDQAPKLILLLRTSDIRAEIEGPLQQSDRVVLELSHGLAVVCLGNMPLRNLVELAHILQKGRATGPVQS